jgi:hypothetical protein
MIIAAQEFEAKLQQYKNQEEAQLDKAQRQQYHNLIKSQEKEGRKLQEKHILQVLPIVIKKEFC